MYRTLRSLVHSQFLRIFIINSLHLSINKIYKLYKINLINKIYKINIINSINKKNKINIIYKKYKKNKKYKAMMAAAQLALLCHILRSRYFHANNVKKQID